MNLRHKILTREEERQLALRFKAGDKSAGDTLIACNQRLAAREAWKWVMHGVPVEDLLQEANIGMLKALAKYEPERGLRFMTYAKAWIEAMIRLRVMHDFSLVKIGTTQQQRLLFFKLRAVLARLRNEGCAEEDLVAEVARCTGAKEREVEEMVSRLSAHDFSLNAPLELGGETGDTHIEQLEDDSEGADAVLEAWDERCTLRTAVREALHTLDPRERFIIEKRVMTEKPMILAEIGKHLGFSREYARQLEVRALAKLRKRLAKLEAA